MLCQAPEPFGIGVCPRCARRASGGEDVVVFLGPVVGAGRRAVREALEERLGPDMTASGRDAVVAGERPLLRVPAEAGPRVLDLLEAQGLRARSESRASFSRAIVPLPIDLMRQVFGRDTQAR